MKCFLQIIILLSFSFVSFAQNKYEGKVIDDEGKVIPLANIVLLSATDSSFINGTTSGQDGRYILESEFCEGCLLRFSSIGYQTIYTDGLSQTTILPKSSYALEEIAISTQRPVYRIKSTGFIAEISGSLLENTGTANDVLKQLPGVIYNNGKFEIFGKGTATIYINNKQVRDEAELERLNSENIVSVELVNNPGIRYDSDVRAVLKICTKRKYEGFASRIRLRGTQNHRFSNLEQLDMSYTTDEINWYGLMSHNAPNSQIDGRNNITIRNNNGTIYDLCSNMEDWKQTAHFATLATGMGIRLAQGHEIGTSYTYDYSNSTYEGFDIEKLLSNNTEISRLSNFSFSNNKYNQHNINIYYTGNLGEHTVMNLNADYVHRDADSRGKVKEEEKGQTRTVTSINNSIYNLYAVKVAVNQTIGKNTLETGLDFSYMDYDQTFLNKENYLPNGLFSSAETKIAGFVNYGMQLGILKVEAGLRYEYFHAKYYEEDPEIPLLTRTYKELYPTASLSLPIDKINFSLSYSKRTARPSFYQLRNGIEYTSIYLYSQGNPYLRSSQLHDISLNTGYRFFFLSLGYSYTKDRMVMADHLLNSNPFTLVLSHQNISHYQGINGMLTFKRQIGLWNPAWTVAIYKDYLNLYDDKGRKIKLGQPYGYVALNNMFTFPKGFILNIDGTGMTSGNSGEVFMKPTMSLNWGIRKSFLKGALELDLQFQDVLHTSKRKMIIHTEHANYYRWNYNDSRLIRLSIVYKFNTYTKKYKGKNSAQSEVWRM
ncbi:MAG: outer membrane beta-barrel protein [Parabacteroides sp.]|nr:outer membrane beta-barrel protein [Parabacteroides sp.]